MRWYLVRSLLLAAVAALGGACGGSDDGGGITNPPPGGAAVATVTVSAPPGPFVPGQTAQLAVTLRDASGAELTGRTVTWSSSADAVARVSAAGEVAAVGPGAATITATSEEKSGSATLDVEEGGLVAPSGGTITALGGAVRLVVPSGAVASPTAITVERATSLPRDPSLVLQSGIVLWPGGTTLTAPAQLTVRYDPAQGPSGVPESDLRVHRLQGGSLAGLGGTVDGAANIATAPVMELGTFAVRRAPPSTPCTAPEYRQFDFWLGRWNVQVANVPPGAPPAPSDITLEPGGCAVFESFANGSGLSLNVFSPATGNWHQTFMFSNGQRQVLIGGRQGSLMILTGPAQGPPGSFDRWTWTPLPGGRVRQVQEQSNDGGQTVRTFFDGTYVPR